LTAGGTVEGIQSALNDFKGLSHRLEYVATINEVEFFNDSKATNVDAVARALETFNKPVILIMGGRDKGGDFRALKDLVRRHTKKLIVIGEAKEKIKSDLGDLVAAQTASSMEEAVCFAYQAAAPGDVVLLSPACASFDMFSSYAHRGKVFCMAVENLK
jgi:UDP-N-acetylmuramoylalanine--D-glutamate ligase